MINSKFTTLIKAIHGFLLKIRFRFVNIGKYSLPGTKMVNSNEHIIISLTSYGRRVKSTLPYTLISLLRQTRVPDRIVVWLDKSWNDDNLPKNLLQFKNSGVLINYCDDYKSYKKLIPSLLDYPNDMIITCDDDLFYDKHMVERLLLAHQTHPRSICCQLAHGIQFLNDDLLPYNQWIEEIYNVRKNVFPLGGAGCLYKREFLHEDVVNYELASALSPKADDVWFYFMGVLNKTNRFVLPYQKNIVIPLDAFYQYFHKGTSLMEDNLSLGLNDKQIKRVMEHYSISGKDLQNI